MASTDLDPDTLRVRTPEDLLALVPVLLGFTPTESVTMVTLGSPVPMHARVDLPADGAARAAVTRVLLDPCRGHAVTAVVLVLHSDRAELARRCAAALLLAFAEAEIAVLTVLRAEEQEWFELHSDAGGWRPGVAYDIATHPFIAEAVLRGQVLFSSREAMAQTLEPRPDRRAAVAARIAEAGAITETDARVIGGWVRDAVAGGGSLSADQTARLLVAWECAAVRDTIYTGLRRDNAREHVRLWTEVVTSAPDPLRPRASAMLALAAWVAGNGALAWCALDLIEERAADEGLARLVRDLLEGAVPPTLWGEVVARATGLDPG